MYKMKKVFLIFIAVIAFAFASVAQQVTVTWNDNYSGYYTVKLYVQTNDNPPSTLILVGEKKNIPTTYTFFQASDINLVPVGIINDRRDYYRYVAYVFRQDDPSYDGYGYTVWLDSDEVYDSHTIPNIQIAQ